MTTTQGLWRARLPVLIAGVFVLAFVALVAVAFDRQRGTSELGAGGRINTVGTFIRFANRAAPDFTLPDLRGGKDIALADLRGQVVIVNFWGSWCPPCREEAPVLAAFAREYADDGVTVIGIDVWEKDWNDGRAFLEEFRVDYPNVYDARGRVTIDYGVSGVPETFFIGPDGQLLGKYTGPLESADQLLSILAELGITLSPQR